jgi:hypothetical protein
MRKYYSSGIIVQGKGTKRRSNRFFVVNPGKKKNTKCDGNQMWL